MNTATGLRKFEMEGKYLINHVNSKTKKDHITLVCCFSRKLFIPIFFKALEQMDIPRDEVHLIVYDNTDDKQLEAELIPVVEGLKDSYLSVRLYKSYIHHKYTSDGKPDKPFSDSKTSNIWEMWKDLPNHIHTDYFFQLEDDTLAPADAFMVLCRDLKQNPAAAYITGIETSRSAIPWFPCRLGVHKMRVCPCGGRNKILERHSLDPDTKGTVPVSCSGVYCFAARTKEFFSGLKGFDPYKINPPIWALDMLFTRNMRVHGHSIYANFNVWCHHLHANGARIIAWGKEQAVEMVDLWLPEYENYAMGIEVCKDGKPRVTKPADSWEL